MEDEVPFDLMEGILCRLPVKSLVRFKVVCRRWLFLIKDPKFIKLHHQRSGNRLVTVTDNQICSVDLSTLHVTKESDIPFGESPPKSIRLEGACNGLLCLSTWDNNNNYNMMVWNMSTKEHKILPGFLPGFRAPAPLVGFGYDHCNDDYKVVCFYDWGHRAMFYSLRLNSWESKHYNRKIFRHCRLLPPCGGVYVDGAFNWRARHKDKVEILISLEFNTGNVRTDMHLPYHEHNDCVTSFDVLEGNLCIGFLKDTGRRMKEYGNEDVVTDIWVMKEFGNDESWTKLFSIRGTPYKPLTCIHGDQVLLLSSDANGDDKANLIYYNLNNKKFSLPVRIPELDYYFGRICHESLVPINQD